MSDYQLKKGRPEDLSGRTEKEIRCYDLLDALGIEYHRIDHEPAENMEDCAAVDEALGATICKNLFLCNRQQTRFYLLLIPGDKALKTKDLSRQVGSSRLSFAGAEHMERYLDNAPGSVSILGLMNDKENAVRLLVDEEILKGEYVGCHPCINTSSLRIRTQDMFGKLLEAMRHDLTIVLLPRYEEN